MFTHIGVVIYEVIITATFFAIVVQKDCDSIALRAESDIVRIADKAVVFIIAGNAHSIVRNLTSIALRLAKFSVVV